MEQQKKKHLVYICGPINTPEYYKAFEDMEGKLTAMGYTPLSPARLPEDLTFNQRHSITTAMIDEADAVVMLPNWRSCEAAVMEHYMAYGFIRPIVELRESTPEGKNPVGVVHAWLKHDLQEVLT